MDAVAPRHEECSKGVAVTLRTDVTRVDNKALFLNYRVQETAGHTNDWTPPWNRTTSVRLRQAGQNSSIRDFFPKRAVHASEAERGHCKAWCAPFSAVLRVWAGTLGVISAGVRRTRTMRHPSSMRMDASFSTSR